VGRVAVQMSGGISASVTLCEGPPASLRIAPVGAEPDGAALAVGASHYHPHTRISGYSGLSLDVGPRVTSAWVSDQLTRSGLAQGWLCERPTPDTWRPNQMLDGSRITGCSFQLYGGAGWRLEVGLQPGV